MYIMILVANAAWLGLENIVWRLVSALRKKLVLAKLFCDALQVLLVKYQKMYLFKI